MFGEQFTLLLHKACKVAIYYIDDC